jgi:hypothetical protein
MEIQMIVTAMQKEICVLEGIGAVASATKLSKGGQVPVILAIQEVEIRFKAVPGKMKVRPYLKNTQYKKELGERLKW